MSGKLIPRTLKLPEDENLLLFGPRGVGKTTYLKALPIFDQSIYINLLTSEAENRFSRRPDDLLGIAKCNAAGIGAFAFNRRPMAEINRIFWLSPFKPGSKI